MGNQDMTPDELMSLYKCRDEEDYIKSVCNELNQKCPGVLISLYKNDIKYGMHIWVFHIEDLTISNYIHHKLMLDKVFKRFDDTDIESYGSPNIREIMFIHDYHE